MNWIFSTLAILGLTREAVHEMMPGMVDQVLDAYPFVGFAGVNSFYIWSKRIPASVMAVVKGEPRRHRFLPSLLDFNTRSLKKGEGILEKNPQQGLILKFASDSEVSKNLKNRVWLQEKRKR